MRTVLTQTEAVVALLRQRGDTGLTPLDALDLVGSLRLAARIHDAKRQGLLGPDEEIVTERVTRDGKTWARYVLRPRRPGPHQQVALWPDDAHAAIVSCQHGHLATREAVQRVGGCPYCTHTAGERLAYVQGRADAQRP